MKKSYVSLAQKFCPICGDVFDSREILLDKRLRKSMHKYTCIGVDLCEKHMAMVESKEYVAFLVVDESTKERNGDGFLIKTEVAEKIFTDLGYGPINYCHKDVFEKMKEALL